MGIVDGDGDVFVVSLSCIDSHLRLHVFGNARLDTQICREGLISRHWSAVHSLQRTIVSYGSPPAPSVWHEQGCQVGAR
jgi:hypothetical protein